MQNRQNNNNNSTRVNLYCQAHAFPIRIGDEFLHNLENENGGILWEHFACKQREPDRRIGKSSVSKIGKNKADTAASTTTITKTTRAKSFYCNLEGSQNKIHVFWRVSSPMHSSLATRNSIRRNQFRTDDDGMATTIRYYESHTHSAASNDMNREPTRRHSEVLSHEYFSGFTVQCLRHTTSILDMVRCEWKISSGLNMERRDRQGRMNWKYK